MTLQLLCLNCTPKVYRLTINKSSECIKNILFLWSEPKKSLLHAYSTEYLKMIRLVEIQLFYYEKPWGWTGFPRPYGETEFFR